jgi:stearoyl-CoA desaturase (delta-9 desaturase)
MSKGWEKFFFLFAYITQGSSYLSPRAYAIMHRMHHAYTDTEQDPHSPSYDSNFFSMMYRTRNVYHSIYKHEEGVDPKFLKNLPSWKFVDLIGHNWMSRVLWIIVYCLIYYFFAPSPWFYLLIPFHIVMGPLHGVIINWYAHKYGDTNFEVDNTSKNLFKKDLLMLGEGYHNNHHKFPSRSNFAFAKGEFDPVYPIILLLNKLRVIKINAAPVVASERAF